MLVVIGLLCAHSVVKIIRRRVKAGEEFDRTPWKTRVAALTCVFLFGMVRSFSLGVQIQEALPVKTTKEVSRMLNVGHIAAMAPFYGALIFILHKWVITTITIRMLTRGPWPRWPVHTAFVCFHCFVYAAIISGIVKDTSSKAYDATYSNVYDSLVIVIFGLLLICFGVSGGYMIYLVASQERAQAKKMFRMGGSDTSRKFIKKMAISLSVFLVCTAWRLADYAVYKWAKNSEGQWVYSSKMQVRLYPLETTFPETVPMVFCFLMYRERYAWEPSSTETSSSSLPMSKL